MIKAVIFDFDGVLFDTEHKRFSDLKAVLKRYELELPDSSYPDMLGKKTTVFVKGLFPNLDSATVSKIAEERRDLQYNAIEDDKVIEGIPRLLGILKDKGIKTAVATGSLRFIVDELLQMHELSSYFDVVVTGEDYGSSKPDPEGYAIALKRLGVKADEAVIIEDAPNGIEAAKKLGCTAFGLKTYMPDEQLKGADRIFGNADEISEFFGKN